MWSCKKCGNLNGENACYCTACGKKRKKRTILSPIKYVPAFAMGFAFAVFVLVLVFFIIKTFGNAKMDPQADSTDNSAVLPVSDQANDERFKGYALLAHFPEEDVYILGYPSFPGGDTGRAIALCQGDSFDTFDFPWLNRHGIDFAEKVDLDGDGVEEIVFACPSGSGTGMRTVSICVFEPLAGGNYRCNVMTYDDLQTKVRQNCHAVMDGTDRAALLNTGSGDTILGRIPLESNRISGNSAEYFLDGNKLSVKLLPQFYAVSDNGFYEYVHAFSALLFDESGGPYYSGERLISPTCTIMVDVVYDGHTFMLENLSVTSVDSAT